MGPPGKLGSIRSALARPLETRYPTNLAVIILMPLAGLLAGGLALGLGQPLLPALAAALRAGLATFAGWALARELAPDDNPAAFLCLGLTLFAGMLFPSASLLLLFTTLMLTRIVNRSVGVPATWLDSTALLVLLGWTLHATGEPGPAAVAAAAFSLDAVLPRALRRQGIFAALSLTLGLIIMLVLPEPSRGTAAGQAHQLLAGGIALLYVSIIAGTRSVRSVTDRTGEPLDLSRVRGGMTIGLLMALQSFTPDGGLVLAALLWAVLAGLVTAFGVRLLLPALPPSNDRR